MEVEDPIRLKKLFELQHPVQINGDRTHAVYALHDLMRMHHRGNLRNPLTRAIVDVRAPGALVAVHFGDEAKAEATEHIMRNTHDLIPAVHFDSNYQHYMLSDWIRALGAMWRERRLSAYEIPLRAIWSITRRPDESDGGLAECLRAEKTLFELECEVGVHPFQERMEQLLNTCAGWIEAHIDAQVRHDVKERGLSHALKWLRASRLPLSHTIAFLREWTPDAARGFLDAALESHAHSYWTTRRAYLTAVLAGRNYPLAERVAQDIQHDGILLPHQSSQLQAMMARVRP